MSRKRDGEATNFGRVGARSGSRILDGSPTPWRYGTKPGGGLVPALHTARRYRRWQRKEKPRPMCRGFRRASYSPRPLVVVRSRTQSNEDIIGASDLQLRV